MASKLPKATIQRVYQDDCTVGMINFNQFRCFTLELPWHNNHSNVSCIPVGLYECEKAKSPSKGNCISIKNVVDRSNILIHVGNYTSDILGCVLVGDSLRDINGDGIPDVTNSKITFDKLMSALPAKFLLEVK